ncbi:MAG TPA: WD40 repeat domain-containing protein [Thermoanaerobaculia bacterium]|jgi:WD40 repeat protein|nr:WD40 repeat domain-containing protein [Thermoanaerobaculia bacterium]
MLSLDTARLHTSPITTLDTAPANNRIATGGYDGRVILWTDDLTPVWSLLASDLVNHVAFDPSGSQLAIAAADQMVYVVDVENGLVRWELGPHQDDVNAVAWHPGGTLLACVMDARDLRIFLWDTDTGSNAGILEGHKHGIFSIAFDPAGERLATAAEDGTARIWSLADRRVLHTLQHPADPEQIAWSPCGRYVATGCDDGVLRVWDAATGKVLEESRATSAAVRFVRFSADGASLLAGSYDATLRVHAFPGLDLRSELSAPFQWERAAAFHQGDVIVGSFGSQPVIHKAAAPIPHVPRYTLGINTLCVSPRLDGVIVAGRDDGSVVDVRNGRILYTHESIVNSVAIAPPGRWIASSDYRGELKVFDLEAQEEKRAIRVPGGPINTIAWRPDGEQLATAGYDGHIRWWTPDLELVAEAEAHHGPVKSLAWSAVTGSLVAGSSDNTFSIWRGTQKHRAMEWEGLVLVNSVACSPVEPHVATASRDLVVRIWHAETGDLLEELPQAHQKSIKAIAYSPNGRMLLTGSYDASAILWTRSGSKWHWRRLLLHGKPGVPAVAFDASAALTAGWDGTVGRWNLSGQLVAQYLLRDIQRSCAA